MQQEGKDVPKENLGWGSKHDPTYTKSKSYAEEAEYDASNAIWELTMFIRYGNRFKLLKAAQFVKSALECHDYSEQLVGNTLEAYIEEEKT